MRRRAKYPGGYGDSLRALLTSPPVRIFAGSRLLIWIVALYAWLWFVPRGAAGGVFGVWARADSYWFLGIAQHGYERNGGEVFYPLYPLTLAGVGRAFGGDYVVAGVVISLACCAAAFALLHLLAVPLLGAEGANRAVVYTAVFPMALFLQAVYSESLYLMLAVAAFLFAERRRWLPAGAAAGLAMLTRLAGVALLPALAVLAYRSADRRRAFAGLAVAPALAALYPVWLQLRLQAPLSEFTNERGWNREVSHAGPLGGVWDGLRASWAAVEQLVTGDRLHAYWTGSHSDPLYVAAHNLEDFLFFAAFLALGVVAWRRFGAPYGLYVLVSLAIPLSAPHLGYPMLSMPRFCLTLFPAFLALAALVRTPGRDRALVTSSAALLAVAVVEWTTGHWVS